MRGGHVILIKNGRVIDPASGTDSVSDVVIDGGVVGRIGAFEYDLAAFSSVIDAEGMIVAPGLVDVHVHFREPGFTHKEDVFSGAAAAAAGGYTTVVCMANTSPAIDNPDVLSQALATAASAKIHVKVLAAVSEGLSGKRLTDMELLYSKGAVGFSDDGHAIMDSNLLLNALSEAKKLGAVVSLHEEDPALIAVPGINAGAVARRLSLKGAPGVAESSLVARDCMIALDTGAKTHFQHLSCAESLAAVKMAKLMGARVSAEVTPSHFSLTENAVIDTGTLAKVNPPLRSEEDRLALIDGLREGIIDVIATDHAPHSMGEKRMPFSEAPSGIIGLETALSLGVTYLVRSGALSFAELIEKMALAPARLYGFDAGRLAEGKPADIVVFDGNENRRVSGFLSKSSNSPFLGKHLWGAVKYTFCGGRLVYQEGQGN
jgi:dihydroorotase